MATVKVLIEGYAKKLVDGGWIASSTVCLVTSGKTKIITDPGCHRAKLLEALQKEGLATGDIDYVFLSHHHPDHTLLAGIFENAKCVTSDANLVYNNDTLTEWGAQLFGDDIEIVETPGHVLEHISLVVKTPEGAAGIAGDAIWWLDDEDQHFSVHQPDCSQAEGLHMETLIHSRKKLIQLSDYIIPGHGKMFWLDKSGSE